MSGIPSSPDPRRSAKQLRKAALAGDQVALGRLRLIYDDLAVPQPTASGLSLRRCQHVIARESGYESWSDLLARTGEKPADRKFVVFDEMHQLMHNPLDELIPRIRSMQGVPDEVYRIREDGLIYCAQALARAVSDAGQDLSQELIDRLLPSMWRPAAEAVERWGVPTKPYALVDVDRGVRIRHDPFNAFLPGVFDRPRSYDVLSQLVTGRYQPTVTAPVSWRGIPLDPIDDLDWRHLGPPPIPVEVAVSSVSPIVVEADNPLLGIAEQRELANHHQAWRQALQPSVRQSLRAVDDIGTLNRLDWHRLPDQTDSILDEEASEIRSWVGDRLPSAIPSFILAGYYHDVTHGFFDTDTLVWRIIGEHLVGCEVVHAGAETMILTAQYAVSRWLDGVVWDVAAREALAIGHYDRRLRYIVDRVDQANTFITGELPQPPRVGPPWRTLQELLVGMHRMCRHVGSGKPLMITQSLSDFDRAQ